MADPQTPTDIPVDVDNETFTRSDVDVLYQIYMEKRIAAQISFYESRMRENQLNADFTFTVGALVMTVSSLIATIGAGATTNSGYLSLISAVLPAFAALLGSFRQLYGWERQIAIYRDSLLGLEKVKLLSPDDDRMAESNLGDIYPKLVTNSETVFTGEINQWGQFILDKEKGEPEDTQDSRALSSLIGNLELSDEQKAIIAAIMTAGKKSTSEQPLVITAEKSSTVNVQAALPNPSTPASANVSSASVTTVNVSPSTETAPDSSAPSPPPPDDAGEQTAAG